MSMDTRAFIKSNAKDMFDFIKNNFDSEANIKTHNFGDGEKNIYTIDFTFLNEQRIIYLHEMRFGGIYVDKEEKWYFKKYGTKKESSSYLYHEKGIPDNTAGILCSLVLWGLSIEIMTILCIKFGGWIDENDCDDIGYEKGATTNKLREIINYIFTKYKLEQ